MNGRFPQLAPERAEVADRITHERGEGRSLRAIADRLNADQVATGQGAGTWRHSSVAAVLRSAAGTA